MGLAMIRFLRLRSPGRSADCRCWTTLANPLAVTLDLRDVIRPDDVQVQVLGLVSDRLQERLIEWRELHERRRENVPVEELPDTSRAIFPGIEEGRVEIRAALRSAGALMTSEQWGRIPAVFRDPAEDEDQDPELLHRRDRGQRLRHIEKAKHGFRDSLRRQFGAVDDDPAVRRTG